MASNEEDCPECGEERGEKPNFPCVVCCIAFAFRDPAGVQLTIYNAREGGMTARIDGNGMRLYGPATAVLDVVADAVIEYC